jgi:hypothetical protein
MQTKSIGSILLKFGIFLFIEIVYAGCTKTNPQDEFTPPYDINVTLSPVPVKDGASSKAFGFVKFRQHDDTAKIVDLDTWVSGLQPNHAYLLQRAVNPITDSTCSSVAWLTLGRGLVSQAIYTDFRGEGHEDLFRNISSVASGTQFRIHFQIVDSATLAPVLSSDCDMYEAR